MRTRTQSRFALFVSLVQFLVLAVPTARAADIPLVEKICFDPAARYAARPLRFTLPVRCAD
jgi:hypothetical protein